MDRASKALYDQFSFNLWGLMDFYRDRCCKVVGFTFSLFKETGRRGGRWNG
jgi:hypothetical protein